MWLLSMINPAKLNQDCALVGGFIHTFDFVGCFRELTLSLARFLT